MWPVVYMFISSSALVEIFFFIIYTVLSLISLTYCEEPVVRTLAAPDTSRVMKLFFFFIL